MKVFEDNTLTPDDLQMLADGRLEELRDFASSPRLNFIDAKGNTPLHHAARMGYLAVCDLFIRAGVDPQVKNNNQQTPADVACAEGHILVARLLSSLMTEYSGPKVDEKTSAVPDVKIDLLHDKKISENSYPAPNEHALWSAHSAMPDNGSTSIVKKQLPNLLASQGLQAETRQKIRLDDTNNGVEDFMDFEPELEAEDFLNFYIAKKAEVASSAVINPPPMFSTDTYENWAIDLSPTTITGEGIVSQVPLTLKSIVENEFLRVNNRGRRSGKKNVVQTGTQLSIDPQVCEEWIEGIMAKGYCSFDDIDCLAAHCQGDGDIEELCINLQRTLEVAGFDPIVAKSFGSSIFNAKSDISFSDLFEAIETTLTRQTPLPGTKRFVMNKSEEMKLLNPMVLAKQKLHLGIISSKVAVDKVLEIFEDICCGKREAASVTLRTIKPSHEDHKDTIKVKAALAALKAWQSEGRVLDGKQRRLAIAAIGTLELSIGFYKELVVYLNHVLVYKNEAKVLEDEILLFEACIEQLVDEYLSYVRRFSARYVEENEDPGDVFQVAFMGLQHATSRFDPERGYRFFIYATHWMYQAIKRWRTDKTPIIRIPVHRCEKIDKIDRTLDKIDIGIGTFVSDEKVANELEWTVKDVKLFREIPRLAEYPMSLDDWDKLFPDMEKADDIEHKDIKRIVADLLAELPERQADVIRRRFGIGYNTEMTLEEIGQLYGLTRERIRQIEAKGFVHFTHPRRMRRLRELLGR